MFGLGVTIDVENEVLGMAKSSEEKVLRVEWSMWAWDDCTGEAIDACVVRSTRVSCFDSEQRMYE
jgi:hypothetical protein